ncbi:MAG: HAD family hydrolase [Candidatus Omnitrophica bacterium]|nr:HAD family hydrolase [Candidatus Omnitrophota bacterium]
MNRAVFLDRDGVVNRLVYDRELMDYDSPVNASQFRIISGVPEAVKKLNDAGYKVIIVSNQPVIAKRKATLKDLDGINARMERELRRKRAFLDDIRYCYHHPDMGARPYRRKCRCRKPAPGLITGAMKEHGIAKKGSFLVGDNLTDILAGKRAGVETILITAMKCELCALMEKMGARPGHIVSDLGEAVRVILRGA